MFNFELRLSPKAEFGNFGFGIRDRSRIPGDELRCTLDRTSAIDSRQNATVQRLGRFPVACLFAVCTDTMSVECRSPR
ncbi:MAG: hypothetical protein EAZ19_03775 [Oscillatoriales cyanobacterium]|nr:MAG: hypothetical protein EAZ19_03775 [Oscillatoriales cyanobacterium]